VDPRGGPPAAAGGELVFLRNSTISMLCAALDGWEETLQRPQRGLHRLDWEDDGTTEFQLGHGDLFELLRGSGFDVCDLIELYAPEDAEDGTFYHSDAAWAKKWPWEEIWKARKQ